MGSEYEGNVGLDQPAAVTEIEALAHDLSNQIMVIQGNAALLQLKTEDVPDLRDLVEQILAACGTSVELTRQVSAKASDLHDLQP